MQQIFFPRRFAIVLILVTFLQGCFAASHMAEIAAHPYPLIYEDDLDAKFADTKDNVFIEVRKTATSRPVEHLAVHYSSLFPDGELIRPGDAEEYVKVGGKNAYKVVFATKYIRKRKRLDPKTANDPKSIPEGWSRVTMEDPVTGKRIPVLHGPVIPQLRILYLVQGDPSVYYVFLRADGQAIESAKKRFEKFVNEEIKYQ